MARIVLDSNLIARSVISPNGLAAEILFRVLTEDHLLCSSNFMLAELDRILRYPRLRNPIIETAIQSKAVILCSNDKDVLDNTVVDFCMTYGIQVLNDVSLIKLLSGR